MHFSKDSSHKVDRLAGWGYLRLAPQRPFAPSLLRGAGGVHAGCRGDAMAAAERLLNELKTGLLRTVVRKTSTSENMAEQDRNAQVEKLSKRFAGFFCTDPFGGLDHGQVPVHRDIFRNRVARSQCIPLPGRAKTPALHVYILSNLGGCLPA